MRVIQANVQVSHHPYETMFRVKQFIVPLIFKRKLVNVFMNVFTNNVEIYSIHGIYFDFQLNKHH